MGEVERIRTVYAGYDAARRADRWQDDLGILAERAEALQAALRALGDLGSRRILDLGCGRGDLVAELAAAGASTDRVVGVDVLADRLTVARDRGVAVVLASGDHLPLADGSVDLVTAFTLFSSITDEATRRRMATEVRRVLAPGGAVVVYDLRLPNPANRALVPLGRRRLQQLFPGWALTTRTTTVLPPLARALAPRPGRRYDRLARIAPLRSHRLSVLRPPSSDFGLAPLPDRPSVSVVLPVRDEGAFIERSLGAVLDQEDVDPPQVILVDGGSTDDTVARAEAAAARRGRTIEVLHNPRRIVPVSMNLGLARATGDVVVRVDGHCVVEPDYVRRSLAALVATGAACVGGPMRTIGETTTAASIAAAQSSRVGVGGVAFRTSEAAAFVDTVAFGAYRREVFDRIGPFDEALVRNQDDELNLRLTRAGGRIWMDPSVRSAYFSRGTLAGLWRQYHGYGFYKLRVMRKHATVPSPRQLAPAAFVAGVGLAGVASAARRSPAPIAAVLAPYGAVVAWAARRAARDDEAATAPRVATATVAMHAAYGLGWWAAAGRDAGAALAARVRRTRSGSRA